MYIFNNSYLEELNKSEKEVQKFLITNWNQLFPFLKLIKSEYQLEDKIIRIGKKTSGRIDILALNLISNKFVIIEIKVSQEDDKVISQAIDYSISIEENIDSIYLDIKNKKYAEIPDRNIIKSTVDVIIMVTGVDKNLIEKKFKALKNPPTYISYQFYNNKLQNNELLCMEIHSQSQEYDNYFKEKPNVKDTSETKHKVLKTNILMKDKIYFPFNPNLESRFYPNKKIKDYEVIYKFRRLYHLEEYLEKVIGFSIDYSFSSESEDILFFDKLGFAIYSSSSTSFYLYAKKNQIILPNEDFNKKYLRFKQKYSAYYSKY